jgi:hypothetical protein
MNSNRKDTSDSRLMMYYFLLLLLLSPGLVVGQRIAKKVWSSYRISAGLQWQGAITSNLIDVSAIQPFNHPYSICGGGPCMPYQYERNIAGFGLSLSGAVRTRNFYEFHYTLVLRYDEMRFADLNPGKKIRGLILNQHMGVNKYIKGKLGRPNSYVGVSYGLFNTGKKFEFYDSFFKNEATFKTQFPAFIVSYAHRVYKQWFTGFDFHLLHKGLPHNHTRHFFMYGLNISYHHGFSKKGK